MDKVGGGLRGSERCRGYGVGVVSVVGVRCLRMLCGHRKSAV